MKGKFIAFFFSLALTQFFIEGAFAQTGPSMASPLTKIIPPSPQAFSIGKYGSNPIGLHTGTVRYSVPIFNFDAGGGYQIPISVSYSSNGVKVDEVASRVGLQWRMDFTGVINRTIMGAPDETCVGQFRPPTHDTSQYLFFRYLTVASESPCGPFQPDQFSYSFPGYSGKFILSGDSVIQIPFNNLLIKKTLFGFYIITGDGTKYIFGEGLSEMNREVEFEGNTEKCSTQSLNAPGITSWHLRKIVMASGFEIDYEYLIGSPWEPIRFLSGISQTNKFMQFGTENANSGENQLDYYVSTCVQQMEYDLVLLTSIKTKNGAVKFFYSNREDVIGEKKLDSIHLVDRANNAIKRWKLGYEYSLSSSCEFDTKLFPTEALQEKYPELRKRLVLTSVTDLTQPNFPGYQFEYNRIDSLPPRLSYAQDYWGYYNGQKNEYFFPAYVFGSLFNPNGIEQGADRDGRFEFTEVGMLKKIKYPTGGYSEYLYEPTQVGYRNYKPFYDTLVITGLVSISDPIFERDVIINGYQAGPKIKIEPFTPRYNPTAPVGTEQPLPDTLLEVRIFNPELQYQPDLISNVSSVWDVTEINRTKLVIPTANHLKLRVMSQYDSAVYFRITIYNPRNEPFPIAPTGYGLKVKEVADFDNFGNKLNQRRFSYLFFKAPEIKDFQYVLRSPADQWLFSSATNSTNWLEVSLHSSSIHSLYSNELSTFSYPSVTEHFIDKNGDSTGGMQYRFFTALKTAPFNFGGSLYDEPFCGLDGNPFSTIYNSKDSSIFSCLPVPGASLTNSDLNDGLELGRINFIIQNGVNRKVISSSRNYFSIDSRIKYCDTLYNIKKVGQAGPASWFKYYNIFSTSRYTVLSNWMHLDSSITVSFEGSNDSLKTVKRFDYGNISHMQPTRIIDVTSKNQELSTQFKYPAEFFTDPIYNSMVSRHIITPVIEQVIQNKTTGYELSKARMNFKGWNNNKFFLPEIIEKSVYENKLQREAIIEYYDTLGNVLQFTGADGLVNSIVWGYGGMYPVAKIVGKTYQEVFSQSGIDSVLLNSIDANEQQLLAELGKLRNLVGSVVSTFTYRPFIGISTETDSNGRTTFYEYDLSGRLIHLKDHLGNIMKKYCYNYAGQQVNCNGSQ